MRSSLALLLFGAPGACGYPNPAYEDSGATETSETAATSRGTTMGPGSDPTTAGSGPTASSNGTLDTTEGDPSGDPSSDTDPPVDGCDALPPPEGTVCHDADPLELTADCDVPRPVYVANVNGDNYDDVLVGCDGGPLLMFPGQEQGVGEPQVIGPAGPAPVDIAVDQLDGDGGVDIVVINNALDDGVRVFFAEGDSYSNPVMIDPGANPTSVVTGFWFDTEYPDILVTLPEADVVARLVSDAPRIFTAGQALFVPALDPRDVALGDFDGAGGIDMAVISESTYTLSIFFNMGNGVEVLPPLMYQDSPFTRPNQLLINDIEVNGTTDILYTRGGMSGVRVFRGDGAGGFDFEGDNYGEGVVGLDNGEFDDNGRPDAVLADHDGSQLIFLMLRDDMLMTVDVVMRPLGGMPWSVAAGTIDGDTLSDVVVSLEDVNEVAILQSRPAAG